MSPPSPPGSDALPGAPRRWRRLRTTLRWATGTLLVVWSLALLAWLTLHWGILPRLDRWRPQIESQVSSALGAPVRIGRLAVRSGGWVPAFEVDDVRLLDRQGRVALQLQRVVGALSPRSLLALEPRFAQLLVEDVQLDVRRDAEGRWHVAGFDLDGAAEPADPAAIDWLFEQEEFVVRRGRIRWTDETRQAPALELSEVDLVLRNGLRRHELRLDATPPADWGDRFSLRGRFTQPLLERAGDVATWSGEAYADFPRADASQLRQHVDLPFELGEGRGSLRAWVDVARGAVRASTIDLALQAVTLRFDPALPPLALQQLQTRVRVQRDAGRLTAAAEGLHFVTDDGVAWAPSRVRVDLQRGAGGAVDGGALDADRIDLPTLARIGARLPLGATVNRWLIDLAPQGTVTALQATWRGPLEAPTQYHLRGHGRGLAVAAGVAPADRSRPGRPGFTGATVGFDLTPQGGQAELAIDDGELTFPGVFAEPTLPMKKLQAKLRWEIAPAADAALPPAVTVEVTEATYANADMRGRLQARWRTGAGTATERRWPGHLSLQGQLDRGDAARVARYLPLGLPERAREYVGHALKGGRIADGSFKVEGDLWHFPFIAEPRGVFRISARAEDLTLDYVPSGNGSASPWPAMTDVAGEVEFDRAAMRIRNARATLAGVPLRQVRGGFDDMAHEGVLRLEGAARGPAADMLRFVDATPVGGWIGSVLHETTASGPVDLTLALQLPIGELGKSSVQGAVQLAGNDVRLRPGVPLLADARGRVEFTRRGLQITGGRARVLGGDATFEGGTQPDGTLRFSGQGLATAVGLLKPGELPALAPLARVADLWQGQTPYRVQLGFPQGRTELTVTSSLAGLSSSAPAPMNKPSAAAWPLRLQIVPLAEQPTRDLVLLSVGDALQARYERDTGGAEPRIVRGTLGVGVPAPTLAAPGVRALVQLPQLDADAWIALAGRLGGGASGPAGDDGGIVPTEFRIRAERLRLQRRDLTQATLDLRRETPRAATRWLADVQADQVDGHVDLLFPHDDATPGRIVARLRRLALPRDETTAVEEVLDRTPPTVPALDIVVEDFRWRGRDLGRLEVQAVNRGSGGAREWQLDGVRMTMPEARLAGSGRWSPGRRMALQFGLELDDSGRFAERLGAGGALKGGKGRIAGELHWAGSPLLPDLPTLAGELHIELAEGRFLNAEPGAARLLSILSLQALPRRLLLDFRDVFQEGFAFDKVSGDVTVTDGVAATRNLRIVGVQAAVLVEGRADLQRETQDLRVVAVPEVNAGAASLAYAAINPAIALGSFLAQLLLREPMMAAGTREFHVTGGWAEPKVERIERAAPAPASAPASPGGNPP